MSELSEAARTLLDAARKAQWACDIEDALPRDLHGPALVELLNKIDVRDEPPRTAWNLVSAAADLTMDPLNLRLSVAALQGVEALFTRSFRYVALDDTDMLSNAAYMAFDMMFLPENPLVGYRFDEVLATLQRVLSLPSRLCQRAALHGLGHLHGRGERPEEWTNLIDGFLATSKDTELIEYARAAREGAVQ